MSRTPRKQRPAPGQERDPDFFDQRGSYALGSDSAAHRRYHWLYEDLLS